MGIGPCLVPVLLSAQTVDSVLLEEQSFTHLPFVYSVYSSVIDRNGDHYLYTTGLEYGLRGYDIEDPTVPGEVFAFQPSSFNGLKPTNLFQQDQFLFVSLGAFHGATQNAGMATVDISDPANPAILDQWDSAVFTTGTAIVRVQDGYAYLGMMEEGFAILDVSDPANISFVSSFQPDTAWPGIVNYPPNARGMALKGDTLFLAYDCGALRAIDVTDKSQPVEIGHYVNPQQPPATALAYNNVCLVGDLCFIATDFCGFEVVDVSDPTNMQQVAWVNPWNCNGLSWFGSDGHTNELITAMHDSLLFISGGDSELLIYDITVPALPTLVGGIIQPNDSAVAWGLDVRDSLVVLNYIDNSLVIFPPQPYYANDGGFRILTWHVDLSTLTPVGPMDNGSVRVSPNPTTGPLRIEFGPFTGARSIVLRDALGRSVIRRYAYSQHAQLDLSALAPGLYMLTVSDLNGNTSEQRVIRAH